MTRIRWQHDELLKLAHHIREQLRTAPGLLLLDATRIAQKAVLPPERRRELTTHQNIGVPLETTLKLLGPVPHPLGPQPEPEPAPVEAPVVLTPAPVTTPLIDAIDVLRDSLLDTIHQQATLTAKLDALTDTVRNLRAAIDAAKLGTRLEPIAEPFNAAMALPERIIPTIGIVGPLPNQYQAIEKKCAALPVKLRQIHPNGHPSFPKTDYIILWTKFLGHRWTDAAYREFDRDRVRLCTGAIVETVAMIEDIVRKQEVAA